MPRAREAAGSQSSAGGEATRGRARRGSAARDAPRPRRSPRPCQGGRLAAGVPERAEDEVPRPVAQVVGGRALVPACAPLRSVALPLAPMVEERDVLERGRPPAEGVRLQLVDAVPAPSAPRRGGAAGGTPSGTRATRPTRCSRSRSAAPTCLAELERAAAGDPQRRVGVEPGEQALEVVGPHRDVRVDADEDLRLLRQRGDPRMQRADDRRAAIERRRSGRRGRAPSRAPRRAAARSRASRPMTRCRRSSRPAGELLRGERRREPGRFVASSRAGVTTAYARIMRPGRRGATTRRWLARAAGTSRATPRASGSRAGGAAFPGRPRRRGGGRAARRSADRASPRSAGSGRAGSR